ncbi:unnamed protein product [Adineta ricciae]|uniref:Uncharacterized protein n=1 Tax=Adineta ricciae TaxID=249248 RepID=A0A814I4R2_ADIRI|nr:unnamed protein product [Adineta ricciae]
MFILDLYGERAFLFSMLKQPLSLSLSLFTKAELETQQVDKTRLSSTIRSLPTTTIIIIKRISTTTKKKQKLDIEYNVSNYSFCRHYYILFRFQNIFNYHN